MSALSLNKAEPKGAVQVNDLPTLDDEFGGAENRRKIERSLVRKLDIRMSILIVIYILNYIDRTNVPAARLRGFERDLNLQVTQYATVLSIFYVGYVFMQVPSNMILNYSGRPSIFLPGCMILWGLISALTGVTKNFVGALLTRFFLGFAEAAFFPGALFLISKWYRRSELGMRTAVLGCGSLISNAFGSLIASGILANMEGVLGHAAWRWLFYIEGALTIFFAICAIFILPDFPTNTTRWLTPEESRLAIRRIEVDTDDAAENDASDSGTLAGLKLAVLDWKTWWLALALASMVISLSFNSFFPTLTATLGYNDIITLLLCAPPWVFTTIASFVVSWHSDRVGSRYFHIAGSLGFGLVGFMIAMSGMNIVARYISLFLMAQSYVAYLPFLAWISNSFPRPANKRAVAIAFVNGFSQLGNIAGSYAWPTTWGLSYRYSYAICISCNAWTIIMLYIFRKQLQRINAQQAEINANKESERSAYRYFL